MPPVHKLQSHVLRGLGVEETDPPARRAHNWRRAANAVIAFQGRERGVHGVVAEGHVMHAGPMLVEVGSELAAGGIGGADQLQERS